MKELERFVEYFREIDVAPCVTHICRVTDVGVYLPSNPVHILTGLYHLLKNGLISPSDKFSDILG